MCTKSSLQLINQCMLTCKGVAAVDKKKLYISGKNGNCIVTESYV